MITQKLIPRHGLLPDFKGMIIAGVDEAGRGALAGPVTAAAVVLESGCHIEGCNDSKCLTYSQRERLEIAVKNRALNWAVGQATAVEIDRLNILAATLIAMKRALEALSVVPDIVLVDGNQFPETPLPCYAIVGGDARVTAISAASILAKTARDRKMERLHQSYPAYNFKTHKGYPTKEHLQRLSQNGHCAVHRLSYKPVRQRCLFEEEI